MPQVTRRDFVMAGGDPIATLKPAEKFWVTVDWSDVPHISEEEKANMLAAIPPHQRDARTRGIPQLGAGAIYPVPESEIIVPDMPIPAHWPRGYGMDVGWNRTAAVFGAYDRDNDIVYLYGTHYRGEAEPAVHAEAIKGRGKWLPGRIDPASRGRGQADGSQLMLMYQELGLELEVAPNGVESGIYNVWERLSTGKMKVFESLKQWRQEFRFYRRDEKGKIVKRNDHLMDCTRYLVSGGVAWMRTERGPKPAAEQRYYHEGQAGLGWMS